MAKAKKKEQNVKYVWEEKATRIFGSQGIKIGDEAKFMGESVHEPELVANWIRHGFIKAVPVK